MSQEFSDPFKNVNIENSMQQNQQFNQPIDNPFGNIAFTNTEQHESMEMPTAPQTDMIQTQGNVQFPQITGSEMGDPFANVNINPMNQQIPQMQQPIINQQSQQMNPMQMPMQMQSNQMPLQMPQVNQQAHQNFQTNAFNQFQQHQQQNYNNYRNNVNHYDNNQQRKYNIIDIAWLINYKLYDNTLVEPECPYVIISYNADFNNLRIGFKGMNTNIPFNPSYLTPNNWFNRTNINLYPENCAQIKYSGQNQIQIIERVFNLNANWAPNSSIVTINQNSLTINTTDSNNNQHAFTFIGYQYELLKHCFDFMLNGQAWLLHCKVK